MSYSTKKLGEIGPFLRGSGLSKKYLTQSGAHKCILYGQLYTMYGPVVDNIVSKTNKNGGVISMVGDVLIPGTTTADEVGIAVASALNEAGVILGGDINIIRTENKLLNSKLLAYLLNGPLKMRLAKYARGTNIIHLSGKDIAKIEVPVPPMQIQKQIVEWLDKIAEAQKLNNNLIQKADELFQSLLHKELNPAGKDWEFKKLKDICEKLLAGGDVPKNNFSKIKTERYSIPIFANGIEGKDLYGYTDIKKVIKPAVTISARGTIGYPVIRTEAFYPIVRLIVLIPNSEIINLHFLYYSTCSFKFFNTGTSIPQLTIPMVERIRISLPPLRIQAQIVAKLSAIQEYKKQLLEQRSRLKELFDSVLARSMKGELVK